MAEQPIFGVTNIPKDIKLELNNGTLTLKSGSVVTKPDGTQVQITSNKTYTNTANGTFMVCLLPNNNLGRFNHTFSGSTAPSNPLSLDGWYDTTNNSIKRWTGGDWQTGYSFPIAIITTSNGSISSIDQVFNGFGYIGSTLFVLSGVEGFCPNGKDGLKNLFQTVKHNSLSVLNNQSASDNTICSFLNNSNGRWSFGFEIVDGLPDVQDMTSFKRYYNKKDNFVYVYNGSIVTKESSVPFGYFTTSSSSPFNITSFEIVSPFATITPHIVSDYSRYLANLLIIQYNSKSRAKATIESLGAMFPDELILAVRDGFNLETATGKQLDILAKYIGAERGYTDLNNQKQVLNDEEFRVLLKLKIIFNTGNATLYGLETSLYNLFETGIRVVENLDTYGNQTMSLTYYIRSDWANVGLAAVQQKILPHPTGVGYTYNLAAREKYFGFIEYNDLSHPYTTGFRDYNDPDKDGEMYSYDKVIN